MKLDSKKIARLKEEALQERTKCAYNGYLPASNGRNRDNGETLRLWAEGTSGNAFKNNHACWDIFPSMN